MNLLISIFQVFRLTLYMRILDGFLNEPFNISFSGLQINPIFVYLRRFFELTLYFLFFSDHVLLILQ